MSYSECSVPSPTPQCLVWRLYQTFSCLDRCMQVRDGLRSPAASSRIQTAPVSTASISPPVISTSNLESSLLHPPRSFKLRSHFSKKPTSPTLNQTNVFYPWPIKSSQLHPYTLALSHVLWHRLFAHYMIKKQDIVEYYT